MQAAGGGTEFEDAALWVFGMRRGAIPDTGAAVDAFLAVEDRHTIRAGRDGLAAADLDADLRAAGLTKVRV